MSEKSILGRHGEDLTANYYHELGFEIIARNFQYYREGIRGRLGEIDLIVYSKEILCFVEVKTRSNEFLGPISGQISQQKIQTLYKTIQYFYSKFPIYRLIPTRFDLSMVMNEKVTVIPNCWNFDKLGVR